MMAGQVYLVYAKFERYGKLPTRRPVGKKVDGRKVQLSKDGMKFMSAHDDIPP